MSGVLGPPASRPMPFTFWEKPAVNSPFRATLRGFRCKSSGAKRYGVRPLEAAIDERQRRQAAALPERFAQIHVRPRRWLLQLISGTSKKVQTPGPGLHSRPYGPQ